MISSPFAPRSAAQHHSFGLRSIAAALILVLCVALNAPASAQQADTNDPIEGFNRSMWAFNQGVDKAVVKPLAKGYRFVVPEAGRDIITNVMLNLSEPVNFLNSALQGERELAGNAMARFLINSTFGLGGAFDFAGMVGYGYHREDFGQTLAVWGVSDGGYFMIPFFGPSTVRDTFGFAVDIVSTPWFWFFPLEASIPISAVRAVDQREQVLDQLDDLEQASLDFYASVRSIFLQRRAVEIANGRPIEGDTPGIDESVFDEDFEE